MFKFKINWLINTINNNWVQFSSVTQSCLTLRNAMTAACQASLSITNSWSLLKFMSSELVIPSNHLILCCPLLLLPSVFHFLASRSFPVSQFFTSGGQSIGASAWSQDWFPLGLTGLISLQSRGLSRVVSSTTVWKHQFFGARPSLWSNSHIHTWLL